MLIKAIRHSHLPWWLPYSLSSALRRGDWRGRTGPTLLAAFAGRPTQCRRSRRPTSTGDRLRSHRHQARAPFGFANALAVLASVEAGILVACVELPINRNIMGVGSIPLAASRTSTCCQRRRMESAIPGMGIFDPLFCRRMHD